MIIMHNHFHVRSQRSDPFVLRYVDTPHSPVLQAQRPLAIKTSFSAEIAELEEALNFYCSAETIKKVILQIER